MRTHHHGAIFGSHCHVVAVCVRARMWELQRFTAGGVVRTIGTGVYHDELCKGVEVGVSRDAVLAAILERGACASE
jgi:hypothetical protein